MEMPNTTLRKNETMNPVSDMIDGGIHMEEARNAGNV